jgi:chromosome segregation ATPase
MNPVAVDTFVRKLDGTMSAMRGQIRRREESSAKCAAEISDLEREAGILRGALASFDSSIGASEKRLAEIDAELAAFNGENLGVDDMTAQMQRLIANVKKSEIKIEQNLVKSIVRIPNWQLESQAGRALMMPAKAEKSNKAAAKKS